MRRVGFAGAALLVLLPPLGHGEWSTPPAPAGRESLTVTPTHAPRPGPPSPDPEPPGPEPEPWKPRSVTVLLSGDVLVHTGVWQAAQRHGRLAGSAEPDFAPVFAGIRPAVSAADLAICHLETPLAEPDGPYLNYPLFSAPPQVVDGLLATGYDACTTASNHAVDMGWTGLVRTVRALDARGMPHTGTWARGPGAPLVLRARGVSLGLISATYGTNGMPVEVPGSVNLIDVRRILREARALKRAGIEVVLVALHAGTEYVTEPSADQVALVEALTASPAVDLVYGHHAHVVQPFDRVNGRWVVHGLGNLVARQEAWRVETYRAMLAEVRFVERRDGRFVATRPGFRPTLITRPEDPGGIRVLDALAALADPRTPVALRDDLRAAVAAVRRDVGRRGVRVVRGRG